MFLLLVGICFTGVASAAAQEPLPTPLPGGEILYVVADGDTLVSIAGRFGLSAEMIAELNGISAETALKVGQRLVLGIAVQSSAPTALPPGDTPQPQAAPVDLWRATPTPQSDGRIVYIVQPGDSLISIAVRFDLTLDQLYANSGLNQNSILSIGQEIELGRDQGAVVPLEGNIPPRYAGATYRAADNAFVHKVQPNETLIEIAVAYGYDTMADFFTVSGLSSDAIVAVGQEVVVGFKPIPQSQGGSTDAPTSTPLPPPTATNTPLPTPLPTNTPLSFPTALATATLAATAVADRQVGDAPVSAEIDVPSATPQSRRNIIPAFIGLFTSFMLIMVVGVYLWYRQQP